MNTNINFTKIKELRRSWGFTRHDMAKVLRLSFYTYRDKEQGKRNFTIKDLTILSKIFKVKVDDLLIKEEV